MKKHLFLLIALLAMLALPRNGRAGEAPEIRLELDDHFFAVARLVNRGDLESCRVGDPGVTLDFSRSGITSDKSILMGRLRVGDESPRGTSEFFVLKLLSASAATCNDSSGSSRSVPVLRLTGTGTKNIESPIAALSPGLDWVVYGPGWRDALINAWGTPKACKIKEPAPKDPSSNNCSVGLVDEAEGYLRLTVNGAAEVSRVELTFNNPKAPTLSIGVAPCVFEATGRVPVLVAGATLQRFSLSSKRPECERRLGRARSLDREGSVSITMKVPDRVVDWFSSEWTGTGVEITDVPSTLAPSDSTFVIKNGGESLGTVRIRSIDKISASDKPKVHVAYDLPQSRSAAPGAGAAPSAAPSAGAAPSASAAPGAGAASSSGAAPGGSPSPLAQQLISSHFARVNGTNEGIAVVTPTVDDGYIYNAVELPLQAPLPNQSDSMDQFPISKASRTESLTFDAGTGRAYWRLPRSNANANVTILNCEPDIYEKSMCRLKGADTIAFKVTKASTEPIKVRLELILAREAQRTVFDKSGERIQRDRILERDRAALDRGQARRRGTHRERPRADPRSHVRGLPRCQRQCAEHGDESHRRRRRGQRRLHAVLLPIPTGKPGPERTFSLFEVSGSRLSRNEYDCQENGKDDEACVVKKGKALKRAWLAGINNWITSQPEAAEVRALNPFFGPQRLIITVKRDGTEIATKRWDIDPTLAATLELPRGTDTVRGNLYTIEVRVGARPTDTIVYRGGTADNGRTDDGDLAQADLRFSAQLRSRGMFGIKTAVRGSDDSYTGFRAYVTIPVQLAGIRFPAATSELRGSSDATAFQYVTPRTGLLAVVEPWLYDTGQNPWPLNPSLAGGILALELSKPRLALSTLLGIQVRAPLADNTTGQLSATLSTALALGVFWEHGVQENEDRVLVSFGANVFSLFGGK